VFTFKGGWFKVDVRGIWEQSFLKKRKEHISNIYKIKKLRPQILGLKYRNHKTELGKIKDSTLNNK
jgi:hypothetical protein